MISIISENQDKTTNEVVSWLILKNEKFKRHNVDVTSNHSLMLSNRKPEKATEKKDKSETIWNRRGKLYPRLSRRVCLA